MQITIDCQIMTSKASAHEYLQKTLLLPDHYGKNLDALYDCLLDCCEARYVTICNANILPTLLGNYGLALLETFEDAAKKNPNLDVKIVD